MINLLTNLPGKVWKNGGASHELKKGVNGYNYAQPSSDADFFPNINKLIKAKYQTIFAIGYKLDNAVSQSAKNNPNVNFAIIDSNVKNRKNVASVNFKTEQSSFLAGVAAAKTTKTNKVGFVGGIDSAVVKTFEAGFKQGVKAVNLAITVDVKYAGSFTKADVGAIEYIHQSLIEQRNQGCGILLVSFELDEILKLADRVLVMHAGQIVGEVDPQTTTSQTLGLLMAGQQPVGGRDE